MIAPAASAGLFFPSARWLRLAGEGEIFDREVLD
jgi:hypothetical protein